MLEGRMAVILDSKSVFIPRGDSIDWEPDPGGHSAGTIWLRMFDWWVGFVVFYDADNAQFDLGSDVRFTSDDERERLRRWLLAELDQYFPAALVRPEDAV
jgi:hypothetical protein